MASLFGWNSLPAWTAILNALAAALLLLGLVFIKRRRITAHKRTMLSAFAASLLFLAVYLLHHWHAGLVYYRGVGWRRTLYFWILGTHTPLAAAVPVLAVITLSLGLRKRYAQHKRWAHWTWPIWMYVSLSGIAVFWMLYR
jgi:putative membrane protein